MAAAYRSHTTLTYASRTNSTITAPSGIQNDDILVIIFQIAASGTPPTPTTPTGFSVATGFPVSITDTGNFRMDTRIYWKVASSESGNYTVTHSSASSDAVMLAASGGNTSTPLNPNPTTNNGTGTSSSAPGLTTVENDSLIIHWSISWALGGGMSPPTGSTPTFTERVDSSSLVTYMSTGVLATAGATGNKSQTVNGDGTTPWRAGLIAINAATGASNTGKLIVPSLVHGPLIHSKLVV